MIEMTINLFWVLAFAIGLVLIFVVARTYNDKLNYKKDNGIKYAVIFFLQVLTIKLMQTEVGFQVKIHTKY